MFVFKSVKWKIQSHGKIPHAVNITPFFENQIRNPNPNLKQNQNQKPKPKWKPKWKSNGKSLLSWFEKGSNEITRNTSYQNMGKMQPDLLEY